MEFASRMKTQAIFGCFVAFLIAVFAIQTVMAAALNVSIDEVSVNDENVSGNTLATIVGETVDVRVKFTVLDTEDLEDLKVKVWIAGYKDEIEATTARFDALSGRTYIKTLTIDLPELRDIKDLEDDLTLHVELSTKNDDVETEYPLTVQRESYSVSLLSVEAPSQASAGDIIALDVVLKNIGRNGIEDAFVTARIPELGLYRKVYFGDIAPEDNFEDDDDAEDAVERRIYLAIPSDVKSGDYNIEVKASSYDSLAETVQSITIAGTNSDSTDNDAIDTTNGSNTDKGLPNSVIVLTVVLVIIFVVLLIVLLVLLTKKPEDKIEDFGETSYY